MFSGTPCKYMLSMIKLRLFKQFITNWLQFFLGKYFHKKDGSQEDYKKEEIRKLNGRFYIKTNMAGKRFTVKHFLAMRASTDRTFQGYEEDWNWSKSS